MNRQQIFKHVTTSLLLLLLALLTVSCSNEFSCTEDYDCPATQVCNTENGSCQQFVCAVDIDCEDPTIICKNNACVPQQTADADL